MNLKNDYRSVIVQIICMLFILLFIYAAVSKLMDFENFQNQLAQSPLLSAYASLVSWLVPLLEILISILLIFPQSRNIGIWSAFNLMVMFTIYIFIILHYSSFVPCSCGGILEKLSWDEHLIFNFLFVVLGATSIFLKKKNTADKVTGVFNSGATKSMVISILSSTAMVVILFISSEQIMHYNNPFTRRYLKRCIQFVESKDLKFNSYYFAGQSGSKIYLGNSTAPLLILSIDATTNELRKIRIDFENNKIPFQAIKIIVKGGYFYLMDGTVSCIYRGNISNWKITFRYKEIPHFTTAVPIDTNSFVFRNNSGIKGANRVGIYNVASNKKIQFSPGLLQQQIDGIFDTDGKLLFNDQRSEIVYVYYYRNEFIVADPKGTKLMSGHTIDTITKAKIKVAYLNDRSQRKMASPPLLVNAKSVTRNNLLFIESKIRGLYETDDIWKYATVIDIYNLKKKSYVLSIPVFGKENGSLRSFYVTDTHFYVIFGKMLMSYRIKDLLKEEMEEISIH